MRQSLKYEDRDRSRSRDKSLGKAARLISDREHHRSVESESEELDEDVQLMIEHKERMRLMKAIADKHKANEKEEEVL